MWVDWMVSPSGNVMVRGFSAERLLLIRTWGSKKCAVAPESAMAVSPVRVRLMESWGSSIELLATDVSSSALDSDAVDAVASSDLAAQLLVTTVLSLSSSSSVGDTL
jgi:hypothetical protein